MITRNRTNNVLTIAVIVFAALVISPIQAATVSYLSTTSISQNTDFDISVYTTKAGYVGDNSGTFGDGTVEGYRFWRSTEPIQNGGTEESYAEGGGIISDITQSSVAGFSNFDRGDVWTVSDPDADPADYGGTTLTISGAYDVDGTIDISGLTSGTVYLLIGGYDTPFDSSLTMTGSGQTTLNAAMPQVDPPTTRNMYVVAYSFDDGGDDYDTIAFAYDGSAGNRARFMGVVVDAVAVAAAVPEPSSIGMAVFGMLSLGFIGWRRRQR